MLLTEQGLCKRPQKSHVSCFVFNNVPPRVSQSRKVGPWETFASSCPIRQVAENFFCEKTLAAKLQPQNQPSANAVNDTGPAA